MAETALTTTEALSILSPENLQVAQKFVALAENLSCNEEIRPMAKTTKCVYSKKKPKRALFTVECGQDKLKIKANLFSIDEYREDVQSSSDNIKNSIKSARKCTVCNTRCATGAKFTLDGVAYDTCTGQSFFFEKLSDDEWERLTELIQMEYDVK